MLTTLESRDTPAIPAGLTDITQLLPGATLPPGYEETHALTRTESHTLTLDQVGSGSSGTFTIDVVGRSAYGDAASGDGELGTAPIVTTLTGGGGGGSLTYHLVVGGTYDNGVFTVTSQSYTETGSSSLWQAYSHTSEYPGYGWYKDSWNSTHDEGHTLTYTAARDTNGVMGYTSYLLVSSESAHWYQRSEYSTGGYTDTTSDTSSVGAIQWDGMQAVRSGARSWGSVTTWYYPNPNGPPNEGSYGSGWTDPVSDTVSLPSLNTSTSGWVWRAGTSDATDFMYHGVSKFRTDLTESARYSSPDGQTPVFEVLDFDLTSHASDSGHTIDDEPGVSDSGTGTTAFHRDEFFAAADDVTGYGLYTVADTDATFTAVRTGTNTTDDEYEVLGDHTFGEDENGDPVELWYNATDARTGSGTTTITNTFHDTGLGLELVGLATTHDDTSTTNTHSWGETNGVTFNTSNTATESSTTAYSYPTEGIIDIPSELDRTAPVRSLLIPHQLFYVQQPGPVPLPSSPARGPAGGVQGWYNDQIVRIGADAEGKTVRGIHLVNQLRQAIENDPRRGAGAVRATGTFEFAGGVAFAQGVGKGDEVARMQQNSIALLAEAYRVTPDAVVLQPEGTVVTCTYGFDQANLPKRSGNIAISYRIWQKFRITKPDGTIVSANRGSVVDVLVLTNQGWAHEIPLAP